MSTSAPAGTSYAAVLLAGGSGARVGAVRNKVYLTLAGRPLIQWSLQVLAHLPGLTRFVLVLRPEDARLVDGILRKQPQLRGVEAIAGGATRHESEYMALQHLAPAIEAEEIDVVLIHDAARPCLSLELARRVADAAALHGGAVPGIDLDDPLYSLDGAPVPSGRVIRTQTPQAFRAMPLLHAYRSAAADSFHATDTGHCVERYTDLHVAHVVGDTTNVKVTYPSDLFVAEALLRASEAS